uniref:Neur_chan_LBD domain-containing protein n=1 Tax=Trichuris muris TaxID=70415 RepID=A0A5S6PZQ4_TRIMR
MLRLLYALQIISVLQCDYQTAMEMLVVHVVRNSRKIHDQFEGTTVEATKISMKVHIRHIAEISEENNAMRLRLLIEMLWYDANIGWKLEDYENIKTVSVPSRSMWVPQLRLLNSVSDSLVHYGGRTTVKAWNIGFLYFEPEVMVSIDCAMETAGYPTDEHECPILLAPTGKYTESVSLGPSANPKLNLYWPDMDKRDGRKQSIGQWEITGITQSEVTYDFKEKSWRDWAAGKNETDLQALKVTLRLKRRIPHFHYTAVLPAALASTFNTIAMYPGVNLSLALMLLFPNLLLQCVLTAYLLKDLPAAMAELPRITKFYLATIACTTTGIAVIVLLLWAHHLKRQRQTSTGEENGQTTRRPANVFLMERKESTDYIFACHWFLFATFVAVQIVSSSLYFQ